MLFLSGGKIKTDKRQSGLVLKFRQGGENIQRVMSDIAFDDPESGKVTVGM